MAPRFLEVKQQLWSDIQRGRFGERLPSENELAGLYAVSRMTLRRSIAELTGEGFLAARPGQGTFVLRQNRAREGARTIGLLVAWDVMKAASDPYFGSLFIALAAHLGQQGCLLTFATDPGQLVPQTPVMGERASIRPVDGVVAIAFDRDHVWSLANLRVPLVLADSPPLPERSCVLPDNRAGIALAVRHLVELGHRRIAHVAGNPATTAGQERMLAWRESLAHHGLTADPALLEHGDFNLEQGRSAMERFLALPDDIRPTAVLCANDRMALGALAALNARGLPAPHAMSVVGFDDIDATQHCHPSLTTVRVQPQDTAELVARTLLEDLALEPAQRTGRTLRVPVELVVRASTGAPSTTLSAL